MTIGMIICVATILGLRTVVVHLVLQIMKLLHTLLLHLEQELAQHAPTLFLSSLRRREEKERFVDV